MTKSIYFRFFLNKGVYAAVHQLKCKRGLFYQRFSKLEIIFCVFLTENYFVNALIPFIGVRGLGYIMPRQYDQRDIERLDVILWSWA